MWQIGEGNTVEVTPITLHQKEIYTFVVVFFKLNKDSTTSLIRIKIVATLKMKYIRWQHRPREGFNFYNDKYEIKLSFMENMDTGIKICTVQIYLLFNEKSYLNQLSFIKNLP